MPTGYAREGALHVALDRDEAAQLRRVHDLQRSLGLEAEWLAPRRCRELEPGLTPSFHGGVLAAGEAAVDPRALARALMRGAGRGRRRGADAAARSSTASSRATAWSGCGRRTERSSAPAPSSSPTAPGRGRPRGCPSTRGRRCARSRARWSSCAPATAPRPAAGSSAPSASTWCRARDGRLVVGATVEERGFDTVVTAGGVLELLREAYRLLPDVAEMELVGAVAGLRPGTPDNLPLIGPGAIDGLLLATGHYRNGILLAPLTAERIAAHLGGDRPLSRALRPGSGCSIAPGGESPAVDGR